jgi:hypothetical protein
MSIPAQYRAVYDEVAATQPKSGLVFRYRGLVVNESGTTTEPTRPAPNGAVTVDGYGTTTLDEVVSIFAEVYRNARQRRAQRA